MKEEHKSTLGNNHKDEVSKALNQQISPQMGKDRE